MRGNRGGRRRCRAAPRSPCGRRDPVEPLAARLGATKGSFYWHFASRDALISAALALLKQRYTEAIIDTVEAEPDPAQRLRLLFTTVVAAAESSRNEVRLLATADHPLVAPVLTRVTERRIGYVALLFLQMGLSPDEARLRGPFAFSAYLGHAQLAHSARGVLPNRSPFGCARGRSLPLWVNSRARPPSAPRGTGQFGAH